MFSKLSAACRFLPVLILIFIFLLALSSSAYTGYIQHKRNALHCIKNGDFKVYSYNLGATPIDKTIKRHQDKELRLHLYEAVSSAAIRIRTTDKIDNPANNGALRIRLGPLAKNGKNVTLIFPHILSEKDYIIETKDNGIVRKIKQLLGIK